MYEMTCFTSHTITYQSTTIHWIVTQCDLSLILTLAVFDGEKRNEEASESRHQS